MTESAVSAAPDELKPALRRYLDGAISAHVAILQILADSDLEQMDQWVRSVAAPLRKVEGSPEVIERIETLVRLYSENRNRCAELSRMLEDQPDFESGALSTTDRVAHYSRLFDHLVGESAEASVAAYSLGREDILAEATAEIVHFLVKAQLINTRWSILQIGCGIGRFETALSPLVANATGIDISAQMIAVARKRCAGLSNVRLEVTDGLNLEMFDGEQFDLVYAVDSFPYVVAVGSALVETYFAEAARVLKPRGHFVMMNFSYRDSLDRDRNDVSRLANANGFEILINGMTPFRLWDGAVFHLRRT